MKLPIKFHLIDNNPNYYPLDKLETKKIKLSYISSFINMS